MISSSLKKPLYIQKERQRHQGEQNGHPDLLCHDNRLVRLGAATNTLNQVEHQMTTIEHWNGQQIEHPQTDTHYGKKF